jgi:hypothetical protein
MIMLTAAKSSLGVAVSILGSTLGYFIARNAARLGKRIDALPWEMSL